MDYGRLWYSSNSVVDVLLGSTMPHTPRKAGTLHYGEKIIMELITQREGKIVTTVFLWVIRLSQRTVIASSILINRSRIVCHCRQTLGCLSNITLDWKESERLEEHQCLTQYKATTRHQTIPPRFLHSLLTCGPDEVSERNVDIWAVELLA
jgi:hypothetical protein